MNLADHTGAVVYSIFGADDEPLYVGYSRRLRQRLMHHRWLDTPTRVEICGPFESALARSVELHLIVELAPKFNRQGNRRRGWHYGPGGGLCYSPERDEMAA